MSDTPAPADRHAHWTKEVQRRSYAMEAAREHGEDAGELARLQALVDEADAMLRSA